MGDKPNPPSSLTSRGQGRAMWRETVAVYVLEPHELRLLEAACATVDAIAALEAVIGCEGVTSVGSTGQRVTHPAVGECRQQRLALARLLGALALPDSEGGRTTLSGYQARAAAGHAARWANVRAMRGGGRGA